MRFEVIVIILLVLLPFRLQAQQDSTRTLPLTELSDSTGGWSEVIASAGFGGAGISENPPSPGASINAVGCARYSLEYRYFVDKNFSLGLVTAYQPFRYGHDQAEGYPLPHFNHAVSMDALFTVRSTKYRENGAFVLSAGFSVSHVRLYATTLFVSSPNPDGSGSNGEEVEVADVADWRAGVRLGLGGESPLIYNRIRIRFMMDYLISVTSHEFNWVSIPGSIGISYAF